MWLILCALAMYSCGWCLYVRVGSNTKFKKRTKKKICIVFTRLSYSLFSAGACLFSRELLFGDGGVGFYSRELLFFDGMSICFHINYSLVIEMGFFFSHELLFADRELSLL